MFTNFPFFPQQASAQAAQVDAHLFLHGGGHRVLLAADRARWSSSSPSSTAARHDDEVGVAIHGSLALELLWTVIPFVIAMVMFGWGAKVFFDLYRPPAGAMEIYVVGKQWMWKVQHMDGQREINELHVPVGRPVKLMMGSEDVIHSFYIPAFRVKADVIPGRYNTLWFTATKPGTLSPVLRRVLRHEALGDDRLGHGDGADRLPGLARRADQRRAIAGRGGREAVPGSGVHHLPPPGRGRPRAGADGHLRQDRSSCRAAARPSADEAYIRESIVNPQAKIVDGLPADHADVPGAGH